MKRKTLCVVALLVGIVTIVGMAGVVSSGAIIERESVDLTSSGAGEKPEATLEMDAGPDQTVNEGEIVQFKGEAKGDANNWVRDARNPVMGMGPPGSWDDIRIEKHDILKKGSEYHLWYTGWGTGTVGYAIGYATSVNGLDWTKHSSNPVLVNGAEGEWDDCGMERISVVWNGSMFLMWYNGLPSGYSWNSSRHIGLATSPDGVNWTKYNDPSTPSPYAESDPVLKRGQSGAWDDGAMFAPSVLWNGTGYEMWYTGGGYRGSDTKAEIGYARSPDGIHWTKYDDPLTTDPLYAESDPVLTIGPWTSWEDLGVAMPDVIIDEGMYKMWYTGTAWWAARYEIGYATSPDGVDWTKSPDNPVFVRAPFGAWDDEDVWTPKVIRVGSTLTMWYDGDNMNHGSDYTSIAAIGVAYYVCDNPLFSWDFDASVDSDGDGNLTNDADAIGPNPTHVYGDNGVYNATLTVEDSFGRTGTDSAKITVLNVAPAIRPSGPPDAYEKVPLPTSVHAMDLGSGDPDSTGQLARGPGGGGICSNEGTSPAPSASPLDASISATTVALSQTRGCDCLCDIKVVESDDDGGTATHGSTAKVIGLPTSSAEGVQVYARGALVLRVAGEKWHVVTAAVFRNGAEEYMGRVVRTPGSPDDQAVVLGGLTIDVLSSDVWSANVVYTPGDDPTNGQINGANPAWLIFKSEYGNESFLHHTFNVQRNDGWTWEVRDLRAILVGIPLAFRVTATDPGSDDLTFTWDWADGTAATATTHFNDEIGADPYPSPCGIFPFTAMDSQAHAYATAGTYVVTMTVSDDDGGASGVVLYIDLG